MNSLASRCVRASGMMTKWIMSGNLQKQQQRNFLWLLYAAANKIDEDRIKDIGPDRACAEWLVKCGASVKFHGGERLISDYNILGAAAGSRGKLAEVFADEATIMSMGFPHFKNVTSVEKLTFRKCARFDDICISHLVENCSECVRSLKIISCGDVSLEGLKNITKFRNLRSLSLHELPEVKNKKEAFDMLVQELPHCSVHYHDENFEMSCEGK